MSFLAWVTALATSVSALVVLMLYLLNKPRVILLSAEPIHWFYTYTEGVKLTGTRATVRLRLKNAGGTDSTIEASFSCQSGVFRANALQIGGKGAMIDTILVLVADGVTPAKGENLKGVLRLEPWGNRTFLIGKKSLSVELSIPYDLNDTHLSDALRC